MKNGAPTPSPRRSPIPTRNLPLPFRTHLFSPLLFSSNTQPGPLILSLHTNYQVLKVWGLYLFFTRQGTEARCDSKYLLSDSNSQYVHVSIHPHLHVWEILNLESYNQYLRVSQSGDCSLTQFPELLLPTYCLTQTFLHYFRENDLQVPRLAQARELQISQHYSCITQAWAQINLPYTEEEFSFQTLSELTAFQLFISKPIPAQIHLQAESSQLGPTG